MLRPLREIEGGIKLSLNVAGRLGQLRRPPVRESFLRQVYFTGVTASTGVVLRASLLGAVIIAVTLDVLDADVDLAVKMLLWVVFREIGPLAAAVVVILRTGTAISAELAMMRVSGQTRVLRYLAINLYDYLVVPRVAAVMLATMALTFYIQALAVLGGLLLSPFIINVSFMELAGRFFELFAPVDLYYSTIKSLLVGFATAELEVRAGEGLRGGVGAVSREVGLISNLNAWENISLPAAYHGAPPLAEVAELAQAVLARFGAEPDAFLARLPDELGALERRLAAFLRLLVGAPELAVFDDIADGLTRPERERVAEFEAEYRARQPLGTLLYLDTLETS